MPVLTRFRLDGGTNQQAARKLLPQEGLLRRVVNLELHRDNELRVRPGFTSLAATLYGGSTATFHDVVTYDGRLFAFGSVSGGTVNTLFEYVDEAKAWRKVQTSIPDATGVREIVDTGEQEDGIESASCGAYDGIVVFAWTSGADLSYVNVLRASDGAPLITQAIGSGGMQHPICLTTTGPRIHIVGVNSGATALEVLTYTPGSTESFGSTTALQTVDDDLFAACAVQGSPGGYVTVGLLSGDLVVRHYNDSHVQQMTRTITGLGSPVIRLSVSADSSVNTILIGSTESTAGFQHQYRTIELVSGNDIAGPTLLSATTTTGRISVHQSGIDSYVVGDYPGLAPPRVTFGGGTLSFDWRDARLGTEFLPVASGVRFAGIVQGRGQRVTGMMEVGDPGRPLWFKDFGTAEVPVLRPGSLCRDSVTGLFYAVVFRTNDDLEMSAHVAEFAWNTRERRQTAIASGLLHISGALPLAFDGLQAFEIGWGETPGIESLASSNTAGGAVSTAAEYFLQAHAEQTDARGNLHRGPPSQVEDITTGGSDDTITGEVTSLHSARNDVPGTSGTSYRIRLFRTAALTDKTAGENLYSETTLTVRSPTTWGEAMAFTLEASDATLRANGETRGTIYTQSQMPLADQAPPPCRFMTSSNERLAIAGLPRSEQWLQSKLRFPGEGIHFADADIPGYQGSTDEAIRAVACIGGQLVAFTRRTISLWTGEGPDHSGQGEFTFSGFLSREGGIVDWRSLVETDDALFFQRETDQLCILSRSGDVGWTVEEGQAVRDELVAYPNVLAACHLRRQHAVVFAVENDAASAGELLVYDTRRKTWSIWDIHAKAVCEYQGRLVYVTAAGACQLQDASPGSGAMPTQIVETFDFDFGTGLSWGDILRVGLVGTKDADVTIALGITYDSGDSYDTIETFSVTTANGYTSGKPMNLLKAVPGARSCSRFGLRWTLSGGSNTLGARINEIVLETETAPGMARLPARDTK